MANEQIVITRNNEGIELEVQFRDSKKKPVDITNCNVEITFINPNKEEITRQAYIKDYVNGICGFILNKEFTNIKGLWNTYWSAYNDDNFITGQEALYYFIIPMYGGVEDEENS